MRVCIFCGASSLIDKSYLEETTQLGKNLAQEGIECIYGGGEKGQMGALARAVVEGNGRILGVIPRFMIDLGWGNPAIEMRITETMHERKALMTSMADAMIALPGGVGTLEELLETITWRQLRLHNKPIIILNTNGYFDPLIKMFKNSHSERFISDEDSSLWRVVNKANEIIPSIKDELSKISR